MWSCFFVFVCLFFKADFLASLGTEEDLARQIACPPTSSLWVGRLIAHLSPAADRPTHRWPEQLALVVLGLYIYYDLLSLSHLHKGLDSGSNLTCG